MGSAHPLLAQWRSSVEGGSDITQAVQPSRMDETSSSIYIHYCWLVGLFENIYGNLYSSKAAKKTAAWMVKPGGAGGEAHGVCHPLSAGLCAP